MTAHTCKFSADLVLHGIGKSTFQHFPVNWHFKVLEMALKTFHFVPGLSRTPLLFFPRYLTNIFFENIAPPKKRCSFFAIFFDKMASFFFGFSMNFPWRPRERPTKNINGWWISISLVKMQSKPMVLAKTASKVCVFLQKHTFRGWRPSGFFRDTPC